MANNENHSKKHRIYLKATRQWMEVPETFYREHTRFYDAFRKKAQFHGQCVCPKNKFWLCDGYCFNCEFRRGGGMLSLDFSSGNEDGDTCTPLDSIPDKSPLLDEIICNRATLEQLFKRLQDLMPEAEKIARLRLQNMSDKAIADLLGVKRTTFRSRLSKAKEILAAEYPDFF